MGEPWQEPVRGEPLPAAAFALDGLERLRGWGRLWRPTPMYHLVGLRITQVVSGSAVASLPVTPWLRHPDGVVEVGLIADSVCGIAADTVLRAKSMVVPMHCSYRPLRLVPSGCRTLVGRANVVRSSPDWVYVEGQVEDGEGRVVARASMHGAVQEVDFPVPDEVPSDVPPSQPTYPTPDPHRRQLPGEKFDVMERFHDEGCVATFQAIAGGHAPLPPLYSLLGIRPVHAEEGMVVTELCTSPWLRSVDPNAITLSYLRTHAVTTAGAVLWTVAGPDRSPAILDFATTFVSDPPADGRTLLATARADRLSDELVHVHIETTDGDRRVASSDLSARLRVTARPERRPSRVLATVLFTDVVDSTSSAGRLGDASWRDLLERHQVVVRARLDDHAGREVKTTGDGFLATFDSPTAAVGCACAIRDDLRALGIEIRAGVHTGEVEVMGGDVAGIAVHVAARIESAAGAGEVWTSDTVRSLTMGSGVRFTDRGRHALKGIDGDLQLFSAERSPL